jgi:hypothetical protein
MMDDIPQPIPLGSLKLMDSLRTKLRAHGYAKPTRRLPSVLSHGEVQQILTQRSGTPKLMVQLS